MNHLHFYESTFSDYVIQVDKFNLHIELNETKNDIWKNGIDLFNNLILYGPPGSGKYSQALSIIKPYSLSKLRYEKKICYSYDKQDKNKINKIKKESSSVELINTSQSSVQNKKENKENKEKDILPDKIKNEDKIKKHEFVYKISDIHYEIDLANLGCNSKYLWHEIFFQIVDIISTQTKKIGIIICKNFQNIHNELLDIFYSYIHHPLHCFKITVKFILITEQLCFIPNNILQACKVISVKMPQIENKIEMVQSNLQITIPENNIITKEMIENNNLTGDDNNNLKSLYTHVNSQLQINDNMQSEYKLIFQTINNNIINILLLKKPDVMDLRIHLYDLFIYGINIPQSIWHIIKILISTNRLSDINVSDILLKMPVFLKYYNNNYRSIYHIEHIILYIWSKITS